VTKEKFGRSNVASVRRYWSWTGVTEVNFIFDWAVVFYFVYFRFRPVGTAESLGGIEKHNAGAATSFTPLIAALPLRVLLPLQHSHSECCSHCIFCRTGILLNPNLNDFSGSDPAERFGSFRILVLILILILILIWIYKYNTEFTSTILT